MLALALSKEELSQQAVNDLAQGITVIDKMFLKDVVELLFQKTNSKELKRFVSLSQSIKDYKEALVDVLCEQYQSKRLLQFLKNYKGYPFDAEDRKKIIDVITSCYVSYQMLKARLYINEDERKKLAESFLNSFGSGSLAEKKIFLTTDMSDDSDREKFRENIQKTYANGHVYIDYGNAKIYLECFPNTSHRKQLFEYLKNNLLNLVGFIKNNPITREEKAEALDAIANGSKYEIFKYIDDIDNLFKDKEHKDKFIAEHKAKVLDWCVNKTFEDLNKKLNGKFEQEDIDYILNKLRNSNNWSFDFALSLVSAANEGKINLPQELCYEISALARIKMIDSFITKDFNDLYQKLDKKLEERDIYYIFTSVISSEKWSVKFVDDMLSACDKGLIAISKGVYDKLNTASITRKLFEN